MGKVLELIKAKPELTDFQLFWEVFPRRKAKLDALKAWNQTEGIRPPIEQLLAAVEEMIESHDWRDDPKGIYLPFPASWLRAGRWDDE